MNPSSGPFGSALGQRLRELRNRGPFLQEEIAEEARSLGLLWTRDTVAGIERGTRSLTVEEFLLIPLIYGTELSDLFGPRERLNLSTSSRITGRDIQALLEGRSEDVKRSRLVSDQDRALISKVDREAARVLWPKASERELEMAVEASLGVAEQKAAAKFGVDPIVITIASFGLWGHSLRAERDSRMSERLAHREITSSVTDAELRRSYQALRGHITRELLNELSDYIRTTKYGRKIGEHS